MVHNLEIRPLEDHHRTLLMGIFLKLNMVRVSRFTIDFLLISLQDMASPTTQCRRWTW